MSKTVFWQAWPVSLRWAVGVSLGIHLLVILPLSIMFYTPIAMPQAPLSAVLKGPGEQTQAAKQTAPRVAPLSAGDAAKNSKPKPRPVPLKEHALREQAQPTPATTVAGVTQGDASAQPNTASRAATLGGAPDTARDGIDPNVLAEYRIAINVAARSAWRKPVVVHSDKKVCQVDVVLSRSGAPPTVVLAKSSGVSILDEATLRAYGFAVSRVAVPPELKGQDKRISLQMTIEVENF